MQIPRKFFIGLLLGTILMLFAVNLIVPQISVAQDDIIQSLTEQELDHMKNGQYEEALADIDQIINLNSDLPDVYYERGTIQIALDDPQSAITDFQKAQDLYNQQGNSQSADYMQYLVDQWQGNSGNSPIENNLQN